jgi:hypothetical protein
MVLCPRHRGKTYHRTYSYVISQFANYLHNKCILKTHFLVILDYPLQSNCYISLYMHIHYAIDSYSIMNRATYNNLFFLDFHDTTAFVNVNYIFTNDFYVLKVKHLTSILYSHSTIRYRLQCSPNSRVYLKHLSLIAITFKRPISI